MPELPEVETVVRGLQFLRGKRIRAVAIRKPKLVSVGPKTLSPNRIHTQTQVRAFRRAFVGRFIQNITRRAKLIIFQLNGGWRLLVHLKMAGQIVVQRKSQRQIFVRLHNTASAPLQVMPSKHTHIIVDFTDGTKLFYNDIRVFGTWRLVHTKHLDRVVDLANYGSEPLGRSFTWQKLQQALGQRTKLPIKQALTDQTLLAGVGNIYADEKLFVARLKPTRKTGTLKTADWKKLFTSLQAVLRQAIQRHGSSVGEFIRPDGSVGTFGRQHKVYGRKGEPCVRCGTPIKRITLGGRGTHFCPSCQR